LGEATKEKPEQDIKEILKKADDKMYKDKLSEEFAGTPRGEIKAR
jgi:hypothetical protein